MSAPNTTPGPWEWSLSGRLLHNVPGSHSETVLGIADRIWRPKEPDAHLIAAAPDYHTACGGDLHPGEADMCGPLAWLSTAVDTLTEPAVRAAASGDDPDAYSEMVTELYRLHKSLAAALSKARGETPAAPIAGRI